MLRPTLEFQSKLTKVPRLMEWYNLLSNGIKSYHSLLHLWYLKDHTVFFWLLFSSLLQIFEEFWEGGCCFWMGRASPQVVSVCEKLSIVLNEHKLFHLVKCCLFCLLSCLFERDDHFNDFPCITWNQGTFWCFKGFVNTNIFSSRALPHNFPWAYQFAVSDRIIFWTVVLHH